MLKIFLSVIILITTVAIGYFFISQIENSVSSKNTANSNNFWKENIDSSPPRVYAYFVLNVNDYKNSDGAQYVSKIIDLFNKYSIGLDLYFTEPVLKYYEKSHPQVIEKIKNSSLVTVNYHVRDPHPLGEHMVRLADKNGICRNLNYFKNIDFKYFKEELKKFESYELVTDNYDFKFKSRKYCPHYNMKERGGYEYVKSLFGRPPLFLGFSAEGFIKKTYLDVLKKKGLRGYVVHRSGKNNFEDNPFSQRYGLLERPADFGIRLQDMFKVDVKSFDFESKNRIIKIKDPYNKIISETQKISNHSRPLFVSIVVHDYDFYRYAVWYNNKVMLPNGILSDKVERTEKDKELFWRTYQDLIKSMVRNNEIKIITAKEILNMNEKYREVQQGF